MELGTCHTLQVPPSMTQAPSGLDACPFCETPIARDSILIEYVVDSEERVCAECPKCKDPVQSQRPNRDSRSVLGRITYSTVALSTGFSYYQSVRPASWFHSIGPIPFSLSHLFPELTERRASLVVSR